MKKMVSMVLGLVLFVGGYTLGRTHHHERARYVRGTTPSVRFMNAAQVVGTNGYLTGWSVTKDGDEVCSDPYIWTSTREIECD